MIFRQKVKIISGFYKGYYGIVKERRWLFQYYIEIFKNDRFEELEPDTSKKFRGKLNYITSDHVYFWNLEAYVSDKELFKNKIELLLDDDNDY